MNVIKPLPLNTDAIRSPRCKMVYVKELDAMVQEDLLADLPLCSANECEPPYGGKDACEFYQDGFCAAASVNE